ncbi:hypothetical protein E4U39_007006 [Claviceps sp. Clav50 group G5]|nr:hypothetical protein E4U39_007006 [Claviceps sp. Clav50 group G5]
MDQQNQVDALIEHIRELEQHIKETDTTSKPRIEGLLPQEHSSYCNRIRRHVTQRTILRSASRGERPTDGLEERHRKSRQSSFCAAFCEYIEQCNVSYEPTVKQDALQRAEVDMTKLKNLFQPLGELLSEQRVIFNELCRVLPSDLRIFPRLIIVHEIGSRIRPIASEKALEIFINAHVQGPVRDIMNMLHSVDPPGRICEIEGDIDSIYHPRKVADNPRRIPIPEFASPHTLSIREQDFRSDGICVVVKWRVGRKGSILIFPYECKPPHNLTNEDLAAVLQLLGNFWTAKKPAGLSQHTWNSVRYAIMQIYDYMIRSLSEFGMLTTGTAIVFLR